MAVSLGCLSHAAHALQAHFGLSLPTAWLLSSIAGQIYGASTFAVFGLLLGPGSEGPGGRALRVGAAFALAEALRSLLPGALPWLHLSYSIAAEPLWIQAAPWIGSLGISTLLAAASGAVAGAKRAEFSRTGLAFGVVVLLLALPALRLTAPPVVAQDLQRFVLVHDMAPPRARPSTSDAKASVTRLMAASHGMRGEAITVWPENSLPLLLPENEALLSGHGSDLSPLILGAPRVETAGDTPGLRASAFVYSDQATALLHDKARLVPVFEQSLVHWHDPGPTALWPGPPAQAREVAASRLGISLCYEILFAEDVRQLVGSGAEILLHLSNEAWFDGGGGPEQLLAAAILRAAENGRPVLRSTNRGITAAIGARGTVLMRHEGSSKAFRVEIPPGKGRTLWARGGDLPLILLCGALMLPWSRIRQRALAFRSA